MKFKLTPTRNALLLALSACLLTAMPGPRLTQASPAATGGLTEPEQVRQLIATLQSPDAAHAEKTQACQRLAIVGTKEAVPVLEALLADEKLAHMARFALEPMPDPAADAALRRAMGKLKGRLRVGVINSVGVRRDPKAVPGLARLLAAEDEEVASAAAAALGRIGTPPAAKALQRVLATAPRALRPSRADACLVCADSLLAQGRRREAAVLYDALRKADLPPHLRTAAMRGAILARQTDGIPLLLEQLRSENAAMTAMALRVARELPGPEASRALAAALGRLPEEKQALLIQALGDRADKIALPAVVNAARTGTAKVRVAALRVLARRGDASAAPAVIRAIKQPEPEVVQAAQSCLAKLPGEEVDTAIAAALPAAEARVRVELLRTVSARSAKESATVAMRYADDANEPVSRAAIEALGNVAGEREIPALVGLLSKAPTDARREAIGDALVAIGSRVRERAGDSFLAGLRQGDRASRVVLLRVVSRLGGNAALDAVRAASQDGDAEVKDAAIHALADWPDDAAAPDLLGIVRTTSNASHRALAFGGCIRLARESDAAAETRLKMLTDALDLAQGSADKKLVLSALGDMKTVSALTLVTRHLADADLADEAGAAVVKIASALGAQHKADAVAALQRVLQSAKAASVLDGARKQLQRLGAEPR